MGEGAEEWRRRGEVEGARGRRRGVEVGAFEW